MITREDKTYKEHKETSIYWYNKSSDLRGSAGILWISMEEKISTESVELLDFNKDFNVGVATPPVYRMLCGMSLELLYKAIVVAKGNKPNTRSHSLHKLAEDAGLNITQEDKGLLDILSESIIWDGRYPVPKQQEHMTKLETLTRDHLFETESIGNLQLLKPNNALKWESFNKLWKKASKTYWQHNA